MCKPLLSITSWDLSANERIIILHSSTDIFSHSPVKLVHSSSTFLGFFSLALSFSNFQTFSIGFMSLLWAKHSITVTSSSEKNVLTDFTVWHWVLSCVNTVGWLIVVLKFGTTFLQYLFVYSFINFTVLPNKRSCTSRWNLAKHHHTSSSKFNVAFSALRLILFLRTASNEPSAIITEQVKLWLLTEINTITLFFSPYDMFNDKFQSTHFVLFNYVRLRRSYSTVQIYFIKSSGNIVPCYFNAKVSIRSFRDSALCRKSILFEFITNLCLPMQYFS